MRLRHFRSALAAAGLVACALALSLVATAPAGAELDHHIYLPFAADRADIARLPAVHPLPTATETPAPTDTPLPTETVEIPPTMTPEPTATVTPGAGGLITGRLLYQGAPLPETTGAAYPGPGLFLMHCRMNEGNCTVLSRTGVDAEGRYTFLVPIELQAGEFFQVLWWNEHGMLGDHEVAADERFLGTWYGPRITRVDPSLSTDMPDFELADFALLEPTHGTGFQGLPIHFAWQAWNGPIRQYRWSICACCQSLDQRHGAYQAPVGMSTTYDLTSQPPGTVADPNKRYCWFIQVDCTDGKSYGQSRQARMMWFIPSDLNPLGMVRGAPESALTGRAVAVGR
jgi:hypothetical protein